MSKPIALAAVLALAAVAGCGGGSDTAPVAAAPDAQASGLDRYAANWSACIPAATGSQRRHLTLTRYERNASMLIFLDTRFVFPTQDCSGAASDIVTTTGNFTAAGTKAIGDVTADKFIVYTEGGSSVKQVFLVAGTSPVTLTAGRRDAPLDADGFPTVLEERSLLRQGDAIRKYVGTWGGCIAESGGSRLETLQLTMVSDTSAFYNWSTLYFQKADCSGTGFGSATEGGFLLEGTKAIGADTVDKVILSPQAPAHQQKQVFLIRPAAPATLWRGAQEGELDADGYPDRLGSVALTRH